MMRIGEIAKIAHCEVETIRFYEQEHLLDAPAREANGYRLYTDNHLIQLNSLSIFRHGFTRCP
jgi:DNA-binding transcriptional MerR regulator